MSNSKLINKLEFDPSFYSKETIDFLAPSVVQGKDPNLKFLILIYRIRN